MKKMILTVAPHLSGAAFDKLCEGFSARFGDIEIERKDDNSIIGGFIADYDGVIYDQSVATRFEQIKKQLTV